MPKKTKLNKGAGFVSGVKKVYHKLKAAHDWAQANHPVGETMKYFPQLGAIPYLGKALVGAAALGYGKKKGNTHPKRRA